MFLLMFAPNTASAGVNPQGIVMATGSGPLTEKIDFGVFASAFLLPGSDPLFFFYAGPGFQVTDWWWSSPRVGLVMDWPDSGHAAPILSLWNGLSFHDGDLTFFFETEVYVLNGGGLDYYGSYNVDLNVLPVSVGFHAEQLNEAVTTGPHISYPLNDHMVLGLQHHWDFAEVHAIRGTIEMKFD